MTIRNLKVEYWTVENTGWSGGVSWFESSRRLSKDAVFVCAEGQKAAFNDPSVLFRVVHTRVYRKGDKEVTIRQFHKIT